jgi:16S rRNA pseudouridine516 synthase
MKTFIRIDKILSKLGYCTRSQLLSFLKNHKVFDLQAKVKQNRILSTSYKFHITDHESEHVMSVDDMVYTLEDLKYPYTIVMNKGKDLVCSMARDRPDSRIVYDVLPENFYKMHPPLACVGRLDKDTTGLLILTQDGILQNFINSANVPKTYIAQITPAFESNEEFQEKIASVFNSGTLMLRSEEKACKAADAKLLNRDKVIVTIREGMYHQVKRMFAACGYRVLQLERVKIGPLDLYTTQNIPQLVTNQWKRLLKQEIELLKQQTKDVLI